MQFKRTNETQTGGIVHWSTISKLIPFALLFMTASCVSQDPKESISSTGTISSSEGFYIAPVSRPYDRNSYDCVSWIDFQVEVLHDNRENGGQPRVVRCELRNTGPEAVNLVFKKHFPLKHKNSRQTNFPAIAISEELVNATKLFFHRSNRGNSGSERPNRFTTWSRKLVRTYFGVREQQVKIEARESLVFEIKTAALTDLPARSGCYRVNAVLCLAEPILTRSSWGFAAQFINANETEIRVNGSDELPGAAGVKVVAVDISQNSVVVDRGTIHNLRVGDVFHSATKSGSRVRVSELSERTAVATLVNSLGNKTTLNKGDWLELVKEGTN